MMAARYGQRKVTKMYAEWAEHRTACRAEGTPAVQATLDKVEQWVDYVFQEQGKEANYD